MASMREHEKPLKALANKRRLAIVKLLKGKKEANVGEIAEHIKLSYKATSKHLAVLLASDIVEKEQRSLECYYSLPGKLSPVARAVVSIL
jgi:DNA-binding transcriptional ArsR family regulator